MARLLTVLGGFCKLPAPWNENQIWHHFIIKKTMASRIHEVTEHLNTSRKEIVCLFLLIIDQGRNEVRWSPGQEASLVPPCLNLRCFRSKCTVFKKVLMIFLGLLVPSAVMRHPRSDSVPGELELCPLCPLPCYASAIDESMDNEDTTQ